MMIAAPPPVPHAAVSRPAVIAPPRFGFADAELGESLSDWRRSRPARVTCAPLNHSQNLTVCRGANIPIGGGFQARDMTYTFVGEKLARIEFKTSIDGFAFVTLALNKQSGPPQSTVRNRIVDHRNLAWQHVTMTWRNGRSTIVLDDPLPNRMQLGVRFTLDALANQLRPVS